jgi:hypothetical protein
MTSLLPDPALIDLLVEDDRIPDPLVYMNKSSELSVTLAEGEIRSLYYKTFYGRNLRIFVIS